MFKTAVEDYDYYLPKEKIAYYPEPERDKSKLLAYRSGNITDAYFHQLPQFLDSSQMLVFNDTKVIPARLLVPNKNGAIIEIFCLEPLEPTTEFAAAFTQTGSITWNCLVGNAKKWKDPLQIEIETRNKKTIICIEKGENNAGVFKITFHWQDSLITFAEWIEIYGQTPLPPYIRRHCNVGDKQRYQTIYARYDGSVAAPTAGLHFTEEIMQRLALQGVQSQWTTLHVGAGTFKQVSSPYIEEHVMHSEQIVISRDLVHNLLANNQKEIIAVGTTVARTLESAYIMGAKLLCTQPCPFSVSQWEIYENVLLQKFDKQEALAALLHYMDAHNIAMIGGNTSLIIMPRYQCKIVKGLITNFHQPKSTLLLLIASFLGARWRAVYEHALQTDYRFLSYGDANLYLP